MFGGRWGDATVKRSSSRYKLLLANYKLKETIRRLDAFVSKMRERDKLLFQRLVDAQMGGDKARAHILAAEIAEIRRIVKSVLYTRMVLERASLRLETISDIGMVASEVKAVSALLKEVAGQIRGIMPSVSLELMELNELFESVLVTFAGGLGDQLVTVAYSEEVKKVLKEAAAVAEQRLKQEFPDVPLAAPRGAREAQVA